MTAARANLVWQATASTGTGNLTLGAVPGRAGTRSFAAAFGTGSDEDVFYYFIINRSAAEWEYGTGHMSDATTLVRDTVLLSSDDVYPVDFSAGVKDVSCDIPAEFQAHLNDLNLWTKTQAPVPGDLVHNTAWDGSIQSWHATVNGSAFEIESPTPGSLVPGAFYHFRIQFDSTHALTLGAAFLGVANVEFSNTSGMVDRLTMVAVDDTELEYAGHVNDCAAT